MKSFAKIAAVAGTDHEERGRKKIHQRHARIHHPAVDQPEALALAHETSNGHGHTSHNGNGHTTHFQNVSLSRVTQIVVIIAGVTAFAYFARPIVLPVLLAWVASMALKPPVTWLRARYVPTPLAAALVVGLTCAAILCAIGYLGRPAADWIKSYPQAVPELKERFQHLIHPVASVLPTATVSATAPANVSTNAIDATKILPAATPAGEQIVTTVFNWTGVALAGTAETIALLFLLLASGDLFMHKLVHVMPTLRDKKRAVELSREIQSGISRYLFSVAIINVCLGVMVGSAFYALGLPNAVMWAAVVALANFIPYFGPVVGICVVALAGLLSRDTVGLALAPAGVYLVIHLLEANLITPFVLGRRFTLNPVIIFIFLIFCIWLWGVLGAFLAVPILVTLKVICDRLPSLSTLSAFLAS